MKMENRQIISDMIAMAKADSVVHEREYDFILIVAERLGLDKQTVDELFENPEPLKVATTELERITQFHRLLLLMNVDQESHAEELETIRNYGLKMAIRPEAIEQILNEMHSYENRLIPTERLIAIFKRFYN